jgi:hypothetical protein
MKKAIFVPALIATLVLLDIVSTRAAGIFSDDFSTYSDGALAGQGPWTTVSGGIGEMIQGHQVLIATSPSIGANDQTRATFSGDLVYGSNSTAYIYTSFNLVVTNVSGTPGTYFACLSDGGSVNLRSRIFLMQTNYQTLSAPSAGHFFIGIGNSSRAAQAPPPGLDQAPVAWPTELTTNVLYQVVLRYIASNATARLWIDPTIETSASVDAQDTVTNIPATLENGPLSFNFRRNSNNGGVGALYVTHLLVGTHFADVAGANTAPTISSIPDQDIPASSNTGPLDFTVDDAETPNSLNVTASSSNTGLIPNANLMLTGSGMNRTITVTPVAGQQGQSTITVNVSDTVNTSFTTFIVRVGAPTISDIPNQTAITNTPIPAIPFTVGDSESDSLTFYGSSSNPGLLPSGNIAFGGSGANRNVTLTPLADQAGVTTVRIDVTDGHTTNSSSFTLTVSPLLGLVFADDFNYTSFPVSPNALYQADGSPWNSVSGTSYEVQVTNGLVYLNHTNTEDVAAPLTNAPYFPSNAVVFYTRFTVNFSFLPSSAGNYFLHLSSSTNDTLNFRCRVFAQTNGAADGSFRLALSINAAAASVQFPLDLDLNTTYTVVTRYNSATSESTLWVNPNTESSPSVSATDQLTTSTVGAISLRETTGIGDLAIGSMRIGTQFTDVITPTAPTPENLQVTRIDGNIVLSWNNPSFFLATAPALNGTFNKINGATSPYTNAISGTQSYFRLTYP